MLKIDLTEAIKELKAKKAKNILLQVPEGLKTRVEEINKELEAKGFSVKTSMEPCFGACDLKQEEARKLNCTAILHLGHNKFIEKTSLVVIYAPAKQELENFEELINKLAEYLVLKKEKSVGLTTTIQFLHYLPKIKKILAKKGIISEIGKGKRTENGQVLGCNYSSAEVKAKSIVYFGDGLFHPLGIHFSSHKKVVLANPFDSEIKELEKEKDIFLKRRILLIEQAKQAQSFGILVSTKEGQNRTSEAEKIQKLLKKSGKKADIYSMDFISDEKLLGISADAFINTACPRISIDDFLQYKKPIINYNEVDYLLGKKKYEEYELKQIY